MNLELYYNSSPSNQVSKTLNYILTLTGYMRSTSNLLNPVIDIEANNYLAIIGEYDIVYLDDGDEMDISVLEDGEYVDVGIFASNNLFNANYLYIPEYHRYYFIDNIDIVSTNLFRIYASRDVLMSHKESILGQYALVTRNEYEYNSYIEDNKYPFKYETEVTETTLDGGNFSFKTLLSPLEYNYVITALNDTAITQTPSAISPVENLPSVSWVSLGTNNFAHTYCTILAYVNKLTDYIIAHGEASEFIISLVAFPFPIGVYGGDDLLRLGSTDVTDCYIAKPIDPLQRYLKLCDTTITPYFDKAWLNYEPYTTYELYLPYYGYVTLKSADILNQRIQVYYNIDTTNGNAYINIYNKTKEYTIKSLNASIGVKISVNRTNQQQLNDEKTQLAVKSAISGIGSVASIIGGAVTYNPLLIGAGVAGLVGTGADIAVKLNAMHETASASVNSGYQGLFNNQNVRLKITRYVPNEPSNYNKYYGLPLNEYKLLNSLSGYTEVSDVHLDNIKAFKDELDEIDSLLKNGVIL